MTTKHPIHNWKQMLELASGLATAITKEDRAAVHTRFNHGDWYSTNDQSIVLTTLTRLLKANDTWEDVPQELKNHAVRQFNENVQQLQRNRAGL